MLPYHLSLGVEDMIAAEDEDVAIHKNFDRFSGVYVDILNAIRPIGVERSILLIYLLPIRILGGDG